MSNTGVIAEFNPFHNGHKYLIDKIKANGDAVICVIGDDFTQRGDVALINKYARAEAALECGADLCLLLPAPWSMSCANNFAIGAVSVLKNIGIVDKIAFGSECGDTELLIKVSSACNDERLPELLARELKKGITFAAARQNALTEIIGADAEVLSNANDVLATEYIKAAETLGFSPAFYAVKRQGNAHDCAEAFEDFISASAIRKFVLNGELEKLSQFVPSDSLAILNREINSGNIASIDNVETAILSILRTLSEEDFASLPEISEGLENRIFSCVRGSTTLEECLESIKTKRYTLARIRRILISAFLGFDKKFFLSEVPYIKVLGFNSLGEKLLKNAKPNVPLIFRGSDYNSLTGDAAECFKIQNKAADLYALSSKVKRPAGLQFTTQIIKK